MKSVSKFLAKMLLPDDLRAMLRIIELAWQLLENWARAKQRGIDEAAHDIAVYIAAASLADMAIKATDSPYYTIPAPDHSWFQFQLDSWLRNSPDKDAARRVHQQGIQFGAAAARTIVQNAEARAVEIRGYYKPDGRPVVVPGLAGARPGTVLLLPPQGFGIMWLRQLKKEGRTRAAIYGHLLERLRKAGVKLRVGQIGRAARAR